MAWVAALTVLGSMLSMPAAFAGPGGGVVLGKPSPPAGLNLPGTPIVAGAAGTDLGYLPGSGSVSKSGQYTYTIPIEVPAGRQRMQPHLSLVYSSNAGNGVLGVGWTLSGLSQISRCGQSLSAEGVTAGVHDTDFTTTPEPQRDRLCLDGQKLVAVNGSYGQDGTEYRTENDQNLKVVSHATSGAAAAEGPDSFTVQSPGGTTRTYTAVETPRFAGGVKPAGSVRPLWMLSSEADASGNGVNYSYTPVNSGGAVQVLLSGIDYTTLNGDASGAQRHVSFSYESRPDQEFSWAAGVESQLMRRLTRITMSAPNPAATMPVWSYLIGYGSNSSFSGRSLLSNVQRCAGDPTPDGTGRTPGLHDCTWKKQFGYTQGSATPAFKTADVPSASNMEIAQTLVTDSGAKVQYLGGTQPIVPNWAQTHLPPMLKVLSATGDGTDDLLLQRGSTDSWFKGLANWAGSPCNGNNLGQSSNPQSCPAPTNFAPSLLRGSRGLVDWSPSASSPLVSTYELSNVQVSGDFYTLNNEFNTSAMIPPSKVVQGGYPYYGNGWLENVMPFDADGSGVSSLLVNDLNHSACGRLLDWVGNPSSPGFHDRGVNYAGCIPMPGPNQAFPWTQNNPAPSADFTGSGRTDQVETMTDSGGNQVLQPLINIGGNKTAPAPTSVVSGISPKCPVYVGDFTGDGRAELLGQKWIGGVCDKSGVLSFNPYSGKAPNDSFVMTWDTTNSMPPLQPGVPFTFPSSDCPTEWNPANCVNGTYDASSVYLGDFNGDGLTDVVIADPVAKTLSLRWNTGNGYGPPISLGSPSWMSGAFSIQAADLNHDGRTDLVVFHEQPTRAITMMLSNGDGSFNSVDLQAMNAIAPADPGLRTFEGWTGQALGDFNGNGHADIATLVGDPTQTTTASNGQLVYENRATLKTLMQPTYPASMPDALAAKDQPAADLLATVSDQGANVNRERISYSSPGAPQDQPGWTDKSESNLVCAAMQYPQRCITKGLVTVRSVTSQDTTANSSLAQHTVYYSYEQPVADMRGRGFLGFGKVRVWDPTRLQQTITLYDNTSETGTPLAGTGTVGSNSYSPLLYAPGYYPGADQPKSITTITAIPMADSPQTPPSLPVGADGRSGPGSNAGAKSVNARVQQTVFNTRLVRTNGNKTYQLQPVADGSTPAQVTTQWEAQAYVAGDVNDPADPSHDYIWGNWASYPLPAPDSAVKHTTTVPSTCDGGGNDPGGPANTSPCIDPFGNITATITQTSTGTGAALLTGATVQTDTTYNNLTSGGVWLIGQPASSTVTDTTPDTVAGVARKTVYDYTSATLGQPPALLKDTYTCQQVTPAASDQNCGSFAKVSTTTLGYDSYGNITSTATLAQGPKGQPVTRQVNTEYAPVFPGQPDEHIFPSQTWSPNPYPGTSIAPSAWRAVQPAYGVTVATKDVNGAQSQTVYDDQGRPLTSTPPGAFTTPATGVPTSYSYNPRTDTVLGGINGLVTTTTTGGATSTVSTDSGGRTILEQHLGFDGTTVDTATRYDLLGRPIKTSRPYSDGANPQYFATTVYDGLDRVLSSTNPAGKTTNNAWSFFTALQADAAGLKHQVLQAFTTDPAGHQSVVDTDVDGNVIASGTHMPDPAPATTLSWQLTTFHNQAFGLQDTVKSPKGVTSTTSFDTLGQITGSASPDKGSTGNYVYDGFGELLSQDHTATGAATPDSSTAYNYEPTLGRELGWITNEGITQTSATFTYDTAQNGLGKLAGAASGDGVSYSYGYDSAGRKTTTTENVGGTNYTISQTYNTKGQPATLSYPAIGTNPNPGLTLSYGYTTSEYQQSTDYAAANPTSQTMPQPAGLWQIASRYNDGMLGTAATPGNSTGLGVGISYQQYPDSGRISEITAAPGISFTNQSFANALDLKYTYTDNGQVQTRTDNVNGRTEGYTYDPANRLTGWALDTCTPAPCSPQTANTATTSYSYDADGNLQAINRAPAPGVQATTIQTNTYGPTGSSGGGPNALTGQTGTTNATYTYDTHGRQTIGAGRNLTYNACNLPTTVTNAQGAWTFAYGPYCERATKQGPDGTTTYIGGLFEKRVPTSTKAATVYVFLVPGIGQVWTNSKGNTAVQYQVTDTQGTTSTVIDRASGTPVTSPNFYDPFGAPINKDGTPNTTPNTGPVTKAFTGQEQDTPLGLDNYNGRLFDPNQKRFTTPDPLVSNPLNPQTWNPYTYVANNPVNATDPTGFEGEEDTIAAPETGGGDPTPSYQAGDTFMGSDGWVYVLNDSGRWSYSYINDDGIRVEVLAKGLPPGMVSGLSTAPAANTQPAPGPRPTTIRAGIGQVTVNSDGTAQVSMLSNAVAGPSPTLKDIFIDGVASNSAGDLSPREQALKKANQDIGYTGSDQQIGTGPSGAVNPDGPGYNYAYTLKVGSISAGETPEHKMSQMQTDPNATFPSGDGQAAQSERLAQLFHGGAADFGECRYLAQPEFADAGHQFADIEGIDAFAAGGFHVRVVQRDAQGRFVAVGPDADVEGFGERGAAFGAGGGKALGHDFAEGFGGGGGPGVHAFGEDLRRGYGGR